MNYDRWNERRVSTLAVAIIYAIWIETIAVRAGNSSELRWWLSEIPFFLWIVAPIAAAYLVRWDSWLYTIGLAAIATYSLYIYERDMFGPGARSTSALIFVFLPLYQWAAVAMLVAVVWTIRRLARK
jgi:hypothetical protein